MKESYSLIGKRQIHGMFLFLNVQQDHDDKLKKNAYGSEHICASNFIHTRRNMLVYRQPFFTRFSTYKFSKQLE